jgi:sarcosine oxidase subunit beta
MRHYDFIVIGAGVIGASVAFHLSKLGARNVLVVEQSQIGGGTTAHSSGILRTHYSVPENVQLAQESWAVFNDFAGYLGDDEASAGLVKCGYLIVAPEGDKHDALAATVAAQQARNIEVRLLDRQEGEALLPIADLHDAALIAYEPEAGFADPYLVATGFARAARRAGVTMLEGATVQKLLLQGSRVAGIETSKGQFSSGTVISTQGIWSGQLEQWLGVPTWVVPERHIVLALEGAQPYTPAMPVFKDLASTGMLYCRSYGRSQMLVSEGLAGQVLAEPDTGQGDVSLDVVVGIGEQVARRFPLFSEAGLASSWSGVYDVTPDWNPVLGRLAGLDGLVFGYGFSGHGFKLSPAVGRALARDALGMPADVPLEPYSLARFSQGRLLTGRYGVGAVS